MILQNRTRPLYSRAWTSAPIRIVKVGLRPATCFRFEIDTSEVSCYHVADYIYDNYMERRH